VKASRTRWWRSSASANSVCARCSSRPKYSAQSVAVTSTAATIAPILAAVISSPAAGAPVSTIDSPSTRMTNSWKRSIRWWVETSSSRRWNSPNHGVR
jgi:uncharacterized paraquat-inducible protein A